jgi:hypothetical protein
MEINAKAFVAEIRQLAADNPDQTAACKYLDEDGNGVCIVGKALVNLGVPPAELEYYEGVSVRAIADEMFPEMPSLVVEWAHSAQFAQDEGNTWGNAVVQADSRVPLEGII